MPYTYETQFVLKIRKGISDLLDLNKICVTRMSRSVSARDDYSVIFVQSQLSGGDLFSGVEKNVGGGEGLAHSGNNAPGHSQLSPGVFVGGETDDRYWGAESGYHSCCHSRKGAGDDSLSFDVDSHTAGGM